MIQFLLPLLVAGIANAAIYCKLKVDIVNTFTFIDDKADIDGRMAIVMIETEQCGSMNDDN